MCSPECRRFKCGKRAIEYRRNIAWCRWTDEECNPSDCNYPICVSRRLLPNGLCGETIKRKTIEKRPEEHNIETIRVRGKTYRKIGEKEIF
jgi:hypothetical protein